MPVRIYLLKHPANETLERTTGEQDSGLEPEDLNKWLLKEPSLLLKAMISKRQYVLSLFTEGFQPGGVLKKFYTGRLRPEVQRLTLLYTMFSEKVPLSYTFYWKKATLSYTFLGRLMNKLLKQEVFLPFFSCSA